MDGERFDAFAKHLSRLNRRDAVKGIAGALVAASALGGVRIASAACRADGDLCRLDVDCCGGVCRDGTCTHSLAGGGADGDLCSRDADCRDRNCRDGVCRHCRDNSDNCDRNEDCCSGHCRDHACRG